MKLFVRIVLKDVRMRQHIDFWRKPPTETPVLFFNEFNTIIRLIDPDLKSN